MNPAQHILLALVRLYRWTLSPAKTFLLGPQAQCRFTPSCSQYALEAVKTHGAFAGAWLAAKRVCRCHPWGDCGHDPVPGREGGRQKAEGSRQKAEDGKRRAEGGKGIGAGSAVNFAPGHSSR